MPNYWIERAEKNLLTAEKSVLEYEKDLAVTYKLTINRLNNELEAFYNRYAIENEISLADAKKQLTTNERRLFNANARTYLAEVERIGYDNLNNYKAYLDKLSGRAYITRIENLQMNIRHELEMLAAKQNNDLTGLYENQYEQSYYRAVFDIQKNLGFGVDFTTLSKESISKAINEKWLGSNYSDRIWANKDQLLKTLNNLIPQEFVRGRGSALVAEDISKVMNVSLSNSKRLARTEMNNIHNKSTMAAYKNSNLVKDYEYLATLDNRTSEICQELDGKVFKVTEAATGINHPPMHPYCRSTTIPYFKVTKEDLRVARDKSGETYLVPASTKYKDWTQEHTTTGFYNQVKDLIS